MYRIKTSDNDGVTIQIAKKNLNFTLIGGISALLTLLDSLKIQSELYTKYSWYIVLIVITLVYVMYLGILSFILMGVRKLILPNKIKIYDNNVELCSGLFTLKANIKEFIITDNSTTRNEKILHGYDVIKPAIVTLQRNNGEINIPIDASELSKLNYIQ